MAKKKEFKCLTCKHYDGENCTHPNNIAIEVRYRQETLFYKKVTKNIKDCKYYGRLEHK